MEMKNYLKSVFQISEKVQNNLNTPHSKLSFICFFPVNLLEQWKSTKKDSERKPCSRKAEEVETRKANKSRKNQKGRRKLNTYQLRQT
jgi:hypothetical protein